MTHATAHMKFELEGRYRLVVRRADGSARLDTGWFKNLVTDIGLDNLGHVTDVLAYIHIGTGNATPANGDTALQSWLRDSATGDASGGAQASAPYYGYRVVATRFTPSGSSANISEIGVSHANTSAATLFSRALILDGGGSPTTITVLGDEYLDAYYELRIYPPLVDATDTITISGTDYDTVRRACGVTIGGDWAAAIGGTAAGNSVAVYSGTIGAITGQPSGTLIGSGAPTNAAYSSSSLVRDCTATFGLTVSGTIAACAILTSLGRYQVSFSPSIVKTTSQILTITFRISWARKTLP